MVNRKFGKLTVHSYAGRDRWNCICNCGSNKLRPVREVDLHSGWIVSCGCVMSDAHAAARKAGRLKKKFALKALTA